MGSCLRRLDQDDPQPDIALARAAAVAEQTGYSRYWIGQLVGRYNARGPEALCNRQPTHSHRAAPLLSPEQLAELGVAVRGPALLGAKKLTSAGAIKEESL